MHLLLIDQNPVILDGEIDGAGELQLRSLGERLDDYEQALVIETRASVVRVVVFDFASRDSDTWTVAASHTASDGGKVAWTRATNCVYHDFELMTSNFLEIDFVATNGGSSTQTRRRVIEVKVKGEGSLAGTTYRPTFSSVWVAAEPETAYGVEDVGGDRPATRGQLSWLTTLYELVSEGAIDAAIDLLFDHVNDLLFEDQPKTCDSLLRVVDLSRLDTNLLVALLSVTAPARAVLPSRSWLVRRIEARLTTLAPDRVEKLMSGLR